MKVDSMDASSNVQAAKLPDVNGVKTNTKDDKNSSQDQKIQLDTLSLSRMTNFDKRELPVSEKVVIDAIERANKAINGPNTQFEFSIHKETKQIVVKVIDSDTNQVIREIPPEKTLDMVAKLWEMAGIVVDERR